MGVGDTSFFPRQQWNGNVVSWVSKILSKWNAEYAHHETVDSRDKTIYDDNNITGPDENKHTVKTII